MINYSEFDQKRMKEYDDILRFLNLEEVTDEEVWEFARESRKIPIFINLYYEIAFGRIINNLRILFPDLREGEDVNYFINDIDTHLYIGGTSIKSVKDLIEAIRNIAKESCTVTLTSETKFYAVELLGRTYTANLTYNHEISDITHSEVNEDDSDTETEIIDSDFIIDLIDEAENEG